MAHPQPEPLVKVCAAILHGRGEDLTPCLASLEALYSPVDFRGDAHDFEDTGYYAAEMGFPLARTIVSLHDLQPASFLPEAKHRTNELEDRLAAAEGRRFNVDIGYLDLHKLVLASFKGRGTKIYLSRGVWADMVLAYESGRFESFAWTFPDFSAGRYDEDFISIRGLYKAQLRQQ